MTVPRPLPYLLALLLGVGSALLVACGGGTKGGIPPASADSLKSEIQDVQEAVEDGRCDAISGQLRQVDDRIDKLPSSVDERLRQRLRDASDGLRRLAATECSEREAETTQTQTTETTETQTTETPEAETTPPETTTAPPETTTQPPPTTVVPPVAPPPPPVAPPVAPPVPPPVEPPGPPPGGTPGGGATPEVGPE